MPGKDSLTSGNGAGETQALIELHTRLLDTIAGYDMILQKAEPEFASIAAEFRTLHVRQSDRVAQMLAEDGHDASSDGSIFGRVNRVLIAMRSWFDDISTNIMDALAEGEKYVLEAFDDAIEATASEPRRRVLTKEREALVALLDRYMRP